MGPPEGLVSISALTAHTIHASGSIGAKLHIDAFQPTAMVEVAESQGDLVGAMHKRMETQQRLTLIHLSAGYLQEGIERHLAA